MDDLQQVPYIVYESAQARAERTQRRVVLALIVAVVLLFLTNCVWLYCWMQYDYVGEETTITQDGTGLNNINRGIQGDINDGADVYTPDERPET